MDRAVGREARILFIGNSFTARNALPEMVAALQFVLDLRTAGIVASDPTGNDFLNYATSSDMFVNGDTAMIIAGDSQLRWLRDMLGTNLGIAPLPTVSSTGLLAVGFTRSRNFYIVDRGDPGVEQALADMLLDALDEEIPAEVQEEGEEKIASVADLSERLKDSLGM